MTPWPRATSLVRGHGHQLPCAVGAGRTKGKRMDSSNIPTSEVLNRAADLIEERGWAQAAGWHPDPNGTAPVCAEGAIRLAVGKDILRKGVVCGTLGHYLADAHPDLTRSLIHGGVIVFVWNDAQKDAAPVIEALRACAVIEASRESAVLRGDAGFDDRAASEVTA